MFDYNCCSIIFNYYFSIADDNEGKKWVTPSGEQIVHLYVVLTVNYDLIMLFVSKMFLLN